ncbi:MAG: asparagine synthase (glutamine-hydrolyzing) [Kofleriaceae bacterium]
MCGIGGMVSLGDGPAPEPPALARMLGAMHHRGPDEFGTYRDRHAGLAHARLSIVDLAAGQQPMTNEDERLWLVFNGEIFNHVELRAELTAAGHLFRTRCDTEVILHAWEQWGEGALDRFNGQWAFALWDRQDRRLVLARDRVGVRPLYYAVHDGQLLFASEVKALFAGAPRFPRRFDPVGVDQTLTFWTAVAPRTVFAGVSELPAGHVRTYHAGQVTERAWWQPQFAADFAGSVDEAAEEVGAALARATELRMLRADVEVGSYLSGGLDSALIATLGLAAKGAGFRTFSLRFADAEYDEGVYQDVMSAKLGTTHHALTVSRADIARVFPRVIWHAERPILRTAPAPMFLLSGLVREHGIKVVLTGEGADEMFAGYDLFREGAVRRFWARAPGSTTRPRLLERLYPYLARSPVSQRAMSERFFGQGLERWREPGFGHDLRWRTTAGLKRLLTPAMRGAVDAVAALTNDLPAGFATWDYLSQDQYLEIRTLLSGYLLSAQGDRMLMGNSVEGRFPFLDRDVMALAGRLPPGYKLRGLDEKHVLKRWARGRLPPEIIDRPKQPYRAPDALAFLADGAGWCDDLMAPDVAAAAGVFEPTAVAQLWAKCRARAGAQFSNTDNMAVVGAMSTHVLWRDLVAASPSSRVPAVIQTVVER